MTELTKFENYRDHHGQFRQSRVSRSRPDPVPVSGRGGQAETRATFQYQTIEHDTTGCYVMAIQKVEHLPGFNYWIPNIRVCLEFPSSSFSSSRKCTLKTAHWFNCLPLKMPCPRIPQVGHLRRKLGLRNIVPSHYFGPYFAYFPTNSMLALFFT